MLTIINWPDPEIGKCELCGAEYEALRPYGPGGKKICFPCGMKNPEQTMKMMQQHLIELRLTRIPLNVQN